MASQRFCLRWNNHQSNLLSVFDQLLHAETFTDVTLAVEGHLLKAHKMVLSACSPYFQALFVSHQEKHPIVILKDVPYADMKSLLDFMYRGEVSVDQERLTAFLRVAESLRIKGLTEVNEDKSESPTASLGPPPQLHRLHRGGNNSGLPMQSNYSTPAQNTGLLLPLLGGSLQPKRKRGRPRKLSGGEEAEAVAAAAAANAASTVVKGEPEKLEIAVGAEGFAQEELASGDEEALLIDEGDDQAPPASPPNHSDSAAICHLVKTSSTVFREDDHPNATPVITLELLPRSDSMDGEKESKYMETDIRPTLILDSSSGIHFLTEDQANSLFSTKIESIQTDAEEVDDVALSPVRSKQELLEYLIRSDGSVVCKICGEILQSRTHWYRHKYKLHVAPVTSPSPIFKCEQCGVFFKSRKGYIGHIASRHPDGDGNASEQPPSPPKILIDQSNIKSEPIDAELAIPRCELPNINYIGNVPTNSLTTELNSNGSYLKSDFKKIAKLTKNEPRTDSVITGSAEWEKQRLHEEQLVANIIARVRRECEAAGASGGTRRGYSRRSALTNG